LSTIVVALGGNAILQPGQKGRIDEQRENVRVACQSIASLVRAGHRVIVTHGNGPQVGNILLQQEAGSPGIAPLPLDVCGALSQGMLGYLLQQELQRQTGRPVITLVTQVEVDPADPAFTMPTKPVGPFYPIAEAERLMSTRGWAIREDSGRGWRRVVPSPRPRRVVEAEGIRQLVEIGLLVIACGGGGIPVIEGRTGLQGVEAVIDKDLSAALLATELGADQLLILTAVPQVILHYGRPEAQPLERITVAEAEGYLRAGHFPAGSMGPKVEAAVAFARQTGGEAVIAALDEALAASVGSAGTRIWRG
jgi:carbamate kinase